MNYLFELDNTSKKHKCPSCDRKTFVRYIHCDTKKYELPYEYGRCDKDRCGYFLKVSKEVVIDYKKNNNITPGIQPMMRKQVGYYDPIPDFIDPNVFTASLKGYENNNLIKFLYNSFETNKVDEAIKKYHVGTSKKYNGGTVFWQVCKAGFIRGGSIMAYDYKTGKRINENWAVTYVHSVLNLKPFYYGRVLFGEHLLDDNTKNIGIVESEKTAIIMSMEKPQTTWLATSGKVNFKYELLSSLKPLSSNSIIIAYPDKGGFKMWNNVANNISSEIQIKVSDILEKDEYEDGCDIADVI